MSRVMLSREDYDRLVDIIERAHAVLDELPGSDSQADFIEDMHDKFEQYRIHCYITHRQIAWIESIGEAVDLYEQELDEEAGIETVDQYMRKRQ